LVVLGYATPVEVGSAGKIIALHTSRPSFQSLEIVEWLTP